MHLFSSKTDENTEADRLGFLLPAHEYFHQSMVVADCESELVRDGSRGLQGGAFFVATLLNRKDAKSGKGKDSIDALKDLILLKADARFCQYFITKFKLDPEFDQTPPQLKSRGREEKEAFLQHMVEEALKDLLPYFRSCSNKDVLDLRDHPLQEGRRPRYQAAPRIARRQSPIDVPAPITEEVVEKTVDQVQSLPAAADDDDDLVEQNVEKKSVQISGTRSQSIFCCKICSFQTKYLTVCKTHVVNCLNLDHHSDEIVLNTVDDESSSTVIETPEADQDIPKENDDDENIIDQFWNYKNAEFFMDAIFGVTASFERFGDGLGCYIVNKILLPVFHSLKHSNYSNSIHRLITRVLCEATPKEGLTIIHERFSNRGGGEGNNINRDRRMEYRIGTTKKLIANLGPNFSQDAVQQVNATVDIKEELFLKTRESHGVKIRSGNHRARSDDKDYAMLVSHLTETQAHMKIDGRTFGNFQFPENLMEDDLFNKAEFYRWLVSKNKEAKAVLGAKRKTL